MPLPDERPRQSVANLIGRFEQQTKRQPSSSPGPRSSSVASHTTGDSAKEEVKEKREWPPRSSNVTSPPNDNKVGIRDWPPRVSSQSPGDSPGQRRLPVQPIIQASPFSELKKPPTSPLAKGSELDLPPDVDKAPSPPAEEIEVTPPSRKPTVVESEPLEPVESEPIETPKTLPQPTVTPPTTKPGPSSVATKPPSKAAKSTPPKTATNALNKLPPSSFTKGTPLHPDVSDRRTSSGRPPSRPASRTNLRSKTPTPSVPGRPPSSVRRKPPTETPKHTSTPTKRSETSGTPSKPSPVIPKTPNSRLYAPTAASLAKSANSPQPPLPERKKTLSSELSLERLSKPTASSLSKSKSVHSLASTTSPPKSKPTPTRTGTKMSTITNKSDGRNKALGSTTAKASATKDGDVHQEHHENGHEVVEVALVEDHGDEHSGNGSLEVSYIEDSMDMAEGASVHDHDEVAHSLISQEWVTAPEDLVGSRSPEPIDPTLTLLDEEDVTPELSHEVSIDTVEEEPKLEGAKDDIADIVGLLESTSFSSKHILRGHEGIDANPRTPSLDKEGQRIGEIPDEE